MKKCPIVFSGPFFSPNTVKYGLEKTPYLDTFQAVEYLKNLLIRRACRDQFSVKLDAESFESFCFSLYRTLLNKNKIMYTKSFESKTS